MNINICHITTVHPRIDTRIFIKMCSSLARNGFSTSLIVADGKGDETIKKVKVFDVGNEPNGRLSRMTRTAYKALRKAIKINADIYHLHDPELIPIGLKLKKIGKKVIFDAHEDIPKQLLSKDYLHPFSAKILSCFFLIFEKVSLQRLNFIVAATPNIYEKYADWRLKVIDINNYPVIQEFQSQADYQNRPHEVAYVGGISAARGVKEVIRSLSHCRKGVRLNLAGNFSSAALRDEVLRYPRWHAVNALGFLDREKVKATLGRSRAGIVTFLPFSNHIDAQPNKMFEYMAAGIPVISSDFPLWRNIIEGNHCGLCVNPLDSKEIARAIDWIIDNPGKAEKMGRNGQKAVLKKYNWNIEEKKLLKLYIFISKH